MNKPQWLSFTLHLHFAKHGKKCTTQYSSLPLLTVLKQSENQSGDYFSSLTYIRSQYCYFLIRFAQTKTTLFIFVNNWVIREKESFLIVEPCSRVKRCEEIKLQIFSRKCIFICTIYTLLMQLISAILYDTC